MCSCLSLLRGFLDAPRVKPARLCYLNAIARNVGCLCVPQTHSNSHNSSVLKSSAAYSIPRRAKKDRLLGSISSIPRLRGSSQHVLDEADNMLNLSKLVFGRPQLLDVGGLIGDKSDAIGHSFVAEGRAIFAWRLGGALPDSAGQPAGAKIMFVSLKDTILYYTILFIMTSSCRQKMFGGFCFAVCMFVNHHYK